MTPRPASLTPRRSARRGLTRVDDDVEAIATRAFGRAAGSDHSDGNAVRLLIDSAENYPAWLDAIRSAQRFILFESYIIADDGVGQEFAKALADRARDGVQVFVLHDWMGSFASDRLWPAMRDAGVRVAAFNPFELSSPFGWISRDHRKTVVVDGKVGYVSGLCLSCKWEGDAKKRLEPWRDTGIEIRGPAVAELEEAFDQVWQEAGEAPIPTELLTASRGNAAAGDMRVRVISGAPGAAGTYRLDLLIASIARERLWLTDAYFVGTAPYVQALRAAAQDGVDVRLLVPGASDIPAVSVMSRAGYRSLLEAGVRVFEWNGTMMHAKCAVADRYWSRVGSTNLNLASFIGNYEMDVAIEDEAFARQMADQFDKDLGRATEIVLTSRNRVSRADRTAVSRAEQDEHARRSPSGSAGRAAAGAVSMGSALGAALTNRRAIGPSEGSMLVKTALVVIALGIIAALWPAALAWPIAVILVWIGLSWIGKAWVVRRNLPTHAAEEEGGKG